MSNFEFRGDYIDAEFCVPSQVDGRIENLSPGDKKDAVYSGVYNFSHVDQACESASRAFKTWKLTSLEKRKTLLVNLKKQYDENKEALAELISRETGKPIWEATGEVAAMMGKITITIEHSLRLIASERVQDALPGVDGVIRFKPRGVMAVLGPFNFPGHLPNGHIVPALLTGNTVVFKPSEKTPAVGQFMAQMIAQAGFPEGVFNMIQGPGETGRRLVVHDKVDGVLFTGSYDVGLKIKQETLHQYWKLLALEMGGKNTAIVWDNHNFEKVVYENIVGGFVTAGQRCSCTSRIVVQRKYQDQFVEKFRQAAERLEVGHWKNKVFMGPLIDAHSKEKYLRFQDIAQREGGVAVLKGRAADVVGYDGHYVTPSIFSLKKFDSNSVYQNNEIFGPNVAIYTVDELDEAFEIVNASGFGLVASVFSKNKAIYEKALSEARVGLVNWNRTTNGASSRLPFGGMGKSGNDRPSAHFAVNYCTVPVASLEDTTDWNPNKLFPGVNWS